MFYNISNVLKYGTNFRVEYLTTLFLKLLGFLSQKTKTDEAPKVEKTPPAEEKK